MDLEDEDEYRHLVPVFTHMVMSSPREREKTPNELILIVKDKLDGCVKKKKIGVRKIRSKTTTS